MHYDFLFDADWTGYYLAKDDSGNVGLFKTYDQGLTFSEHHVVDRDSLYMFPYPVSLIQTSPDTLLTFWAGTVDGLQPNDVFYNFITDSGTNSSAPVQLDTSVEYCYAQSIKNNKNSVFVASFGSINLDTLAMIFFKKSENNGNTFGETKVLYKYHQEYGYIRQPCLVYHEKYGLIAFIDGNNGPFIRRSIDNGDTFEDREIIYKGRQYTSKQALAINDSGYLFAATGDIAHKRLLLHRRPMPLTPVTNIQDITSVNDIEFPFVLTYPNPFNPNTRIRFSLLEKEPVRIAIYDVNGKLIKKIADKTLSAGTHEYVWNGRTDHNNSVGSGLYFCRITAGSKSKTMKLILIR